MGPSDLENILSGVLEEYQRDSYRAKILVGLGDDAGVFLINDTAIVETVDVITPLVNDPFTFGSISACNSLSDIYAMGGKPLSCLAIIGYPSCDYEPSVLREIIRGAQNILSKAGAFLIGGHTFEDNELKFGLSVTGIVNEDRILKTKGAQRGDLIILTKPIGIGILTTALKGEKIRDEDLQEAINWMLALNDIPSSLAVEANATACTDVSGFGLLGHAVNMVKDSEIDFVIQKDEVPTLNNAMTLIDFGMVPEGTYRNLNFFKTWIDFSSSVTEEEKLLLLDPQTSGGLLITLQRDNLKVFTESGIFFSIIGTVKEGKGRIIVD
ncbi:MAG: selenide, water dikinase SelD [Thermodesulfovibrionales bacterium]|nr:selenide, water dikinase SelD [Thermodesulfovibrionales bacterium]